MNTRSPILAALTATATSFLVGVGPSLASTFDYEIQANISEAVIWDSIFIIGGTPLDGLLVAADPTEVAEPYQDSSGRIHIPVGYSGALTLRVSVRYYNDLETTYLVRQTRPYGYSHMMNGATLNHPWSSYPSQGTFVYSWTDNSGDLDHELEPHDSVVRPFFDYVLLDSFGPILPAVTTEWGQIWDSASIQPGDTSWFSWQVIGQSIEAIAQAAAIEVSPQRNAPLINSVTAGVVQVAILSDDNLDGTQVDPGSVTFGPSKAAFPIAHHVRDVDADGDPDLVLLFRTAETGISCGDQTANLRGTTYVGGMIVGVAPIELAGC